MIWLGTSAGDTESELTFFPVYTNHWLTKLVGHFIFIVPVYQGTKQTFYVYLYNTCTIHIYIYTHRETYADN